jgi:hypothetical protein
VKKLFRRTGERVDLNYGARFIVRNLLSQKILKIVKDMSRKAVAGLLSFSIGGTILIFMLYFMFEDVWDSDIWDRVSYFGWMPIFWGFVGFLLLCLGLWLVISARYIRTYAHMHTPARACGQSVTQSSHSHKKTKNTQKRICQNPNYLVACAFL